jgi:hypothetical protein
VLQGGGSDQLHLRIFRLHTTPLLNHPLYTYALPCVCNCIPGLSLSGAEGSVQRGKTSSRDDSAFATGCFFRSAFL